MGDILTKIIKYKKLEVEALKKITSLKKLQSKIKDSPQKSFIRQMKKHFSIIAEIKKGSPSKGIIRPQFRPYSIARDYIEADADAISVLTDNRFFFGKPEYLKKIAEFSPIPLLRKDFIIDEYQIYESKFLGADMILLIASVLPLEILQRFLAVADELHLEVLTEVHNKRELNKVLKTSASIIGINNRNLKTFKVDLQTSLKLRQYIPDGRFAVSESGIHFPEDIKKLKEEKFHAVLIGESFMRSKNIKEQLQLFQKM